MLKVADIENLRAYMHGLIARSEHHANNVDQIIYPLIGMLIAYTDGEISVKEYAGQPANMLWCSKENRRYALKYNHRTQLIEMRKGNSKGQVIAFLSNSTKIQELLDVFKHL